MDATPLKLPVPVLMFTAVEVLGTPSTPSRAMTRVVCTDVTEAVPAAEP